jgi:hypothetical protein
LWNQCLADASLECPVGIVTDGDEGVGTWGAIDDPDNPYAMLCWDTSYEYEGGWVPDETCMFTNSSLSRRRRGPAQRVNPWRLREERNRYAVKDAIYKAAEPDAVFGGAVLDCIAGAESNWNISATLSSGDTKRTGLYQFNAQTWQSSGTDIPFGEGSADAFQSTAVKIAALYRALAQVVSPMSSSPPTEADVKEAIRRNGDGTDGYTNAVWDCAQAMKAGDTASAISIIDAFHGH